MLLELLNIATWKLLQCIGNEVERMTAISAATQRCRLSTCSDFRAACARSEKVNSQFGLTGVIRRNARS